MWKGDLWILEDINKLLCVRLILSISEYQMNSDDYIWMFKKSKWKLLRHIWRIDIFHENHCMIVGIWNLSFFLLIWHKICAACKLFFWSDGICSHLETRKKRTLTKCFSLKWVLSGMKIVLNVTENGTNHKLHEQTGDIKHSMHQKKR